MSFEGVVLVSLFCFLSLLVIVAITRGWIRIVGFASGRVRKREVGISAVAGLFVGTLFAVAWSPFGSTPLLMALGLLFALIVGALSRLGSRDQ